MSESNTGQPPQYDPAAQQGPGAHGQWNAQAPYVQQVYGQQPQPGQQTPYGQQLGQGYGPAGQGSPRAQGGSQPGAPRLSGEQMFGQAGAPGNPPYGVGQFGSSAQYPGGQYAVSGGYSSGQVPPGQYPPQKSRFPVWSWTLVGVAVVGIIVGVLFGLGVFRGGEQADPTPSPTTTSPALSPTTTSPTPEPTSTPPGVERVDSTTVRVDSLTFEALEYNDDATDIITHDELNLYDELDEGWKVVGVKFKVTNVGSQSLHPYSGFGGPMLCTSNTRYLLLRYFGVGTIAYVDTLDVGEEVEGWLYFSVPQDFSAESAELDFWSVEGQQEVYLPVPN